ncbi:uncharacterized protein N7479_008677 [Penicillium vulpinum]|uniref:uncharacterized protein n=1 Tax=Penicillium vulpinum TaxID=29845 RepID=UPI002548E684|nr:uncharacterized protein N7479_008677 [Penicillium vulpinum]KAJ5950264.1 hypothetical protein N7479_008677 [Penicillium vulpinum]
MAARRRQFSEGVFSFSMPLSLTLQQCESAKYLVIKLVRHYGPDQTVRKGYKPAALIHAMLEQVASLDTFLNLFLSFIYEDLCSDMVSVVDFDITCALSYLDGFASWESEQIINLNKAIENFAELIVDEFLLPLRAASLKTPQSRPRSLFSQSSAPTGTEQRVSILRQSCLVRDHHRCVVSRKFDRATARNRFTENGESCADDDGKLLKDEPNGDFEYLEVAHILPRCLTTIASEDTDLSDSKKNVLRVLDMFEAGIGHLIDGPKIDTPMNALTLTLDNHRFFGEFQIFFEPTGIPHQYRIDSTEQVPFLRDPLFPVTRTLTLSPGGAIDSPFSRLFQVHRAIAIIMKLSGAGDYIEKVLQDIEELNVREDESTHLGYLTSLRLGGWLKS